MWFAALGSYEHNAWLVSMTYRLLNNEREGRHILSFHLRINDAVLHLLEKNPFGNRAPKFIRGVLYTYRFTEPKT